MTKRELIKEILSLRPVDRLEIGNVIDASLSDGLPPQLNAADRKMLLKRIETYKKHPERLLTWEQVKANLERQRAGKSQWKTKSRSRPR